MSKNNKLEPTVGSNHPLSTCNGHQLIGVHQVLRELSTRHVGEVMQFIETLGLERQREEAFKAIVKKAMWTILDDELACLRWRCPEGYEEYQKNGNTLSPIALP